MKKQRNIRLRAARTPAKVARDGPSRLRVLENKLFAQRWDIKGLTGQRNEAFAEIEKLKKEIVSLRAARDVAVSDTKLAQLERDAARRALDAQLAQGWQARALRDLAELCRSRRGWTYDLDGKPALLAEVMLISIGGVFDQAYYARQLGAQVDALSAICHYVERGEREGLRPCALFDTAWYAKQVGAVEPFRTGFAHYLALGAAQGRPPHPFVDPAHLRRAAKARRGQRFNPLHFYLSDGRFRGISPHPLIDVDAYRESRGAEAGDAEPVCDYLETGRGKGVSLSPLFDPEYYKTICSEARTARVDPFRHYVTVGEQLGRAPNPLFEPEYYRAQWKGRNAPPKGGELTHYVCHGRDAGARTHPLFDGAHYRRTAGKERICDPLAHYLTAGASRVRFPHPLFDVDFLRSTAPAALRYDQNPLVSFLRSPDRSIASPHPLFDPLHYVTQVPQAASWNEGPYMHFLRFGAENDAGPHPLFDNAFYRAQLLREERTGFPILHYLQHGSDAGLRPHPLFDPEFYMKTNPDLAEAKVNPLIHFVLFGGLKRDLRQPHLAFDIRYYADNYGEELPDDTNLLVDFLANWRKRPRAHRLFDMRHYAAGEPDCSNGSNPLADYAARGRKARAAPHRLFDAAWYEKNVDVAPSWRRSLLEHYCNRLAPADFFPHPDHDGAEIAQKLGPDTTGLTLLERYIERKGRARGRGAAMRITAGLK